MSQRVRRNTGLSCLALASAMLLLSAATFVLDPWNHRLSLGPQFHIGVWRFGDDTLGRIMFFNDADDGPYRGSLIDIKIGDVVVSQFDRRIVFGDTCGIYYRWFHRPDGATLWTLALSLWYPLLLSLALGAMLMPKRGIRPVMPSETEPSCSASTNSKRG